MKIHDVIITPLKVISDNRGKVMHMLRCDDEIFKKFGEIYFSTIFFDKIKAWHLHKESTLNYSCVKVKLVLFDNREKKSHKRYHSRNYFKTKRTLFNYYTKKYMEWF